VIEFESSEHDNLANKFREIDDVNSKQGSERSINKVKSEVTT